MNLSVFDLTQIAQDLNSGISAQDRFSRLLNTIRKVIRCDASALLAFEGKQFKPLAINGLSPDVLGRRFLVEEHPRLEIIARAGDVVRFPDDSNLPDPYDGLIPNQQDHQKVHACIGLPLIANDSLIGALTIDGFEDGMFDRFSNEDLRTLSALAAVSLNNALMVERLDKPTLLHPTVHSNPSQSTEMIGESATMRALKHEIEIVANSDVNVLVLGETGVGKELVARQILNSSLRAGGPQIYLNCAALPESIAESELFGHVKGAFTGAIGNRKGRFETADTGSLFLDEISELPLSIQAKLLRVIQYGEIQRIGDDYVHKVDVRIIAATNKNLKEEVIQGRFRSDLFHRLSVFPIQVPTLTDREGDIPLLAGYFVEKCRVRLSISSLSLSLAALKRLAGYDWPGNVRELEHCIVRAAILARAESRDEVVTIGDHHFDFNSGLRKKASKPPVQSKIPHQSLRLAIDNFQRDYISQLIDDCSGNWAAAARTLKLDSGNLHRLARRLNLK